MGTFYFRSLVLIFIFIFSAQSAFASILSPQFITDDEYKDGLRLCQDNQDLIQGENGRFISVPVDYAHPEKASTLIYAFFEQGFDPKKETLLYFNGGPGETAHSALIASDFAFNVLKFDPRGVACSRPSNYQQYRDPYFYSSEAIARDADEIRKAFGLEKVSVWGISYGTIPATIYAHLFSAATRALVLEGSIFDGSEELWQASYRRKWMQRELNYLSAEQKQNLYLLTDKLQIPSYWMSLVARKFMGENHGLRNWRLWLQDLEKNLDKQNQLQAAFSGELERNIEILDLDHTVYGMIACQELSLGDESAFPVDDFDGARFVRSTKNFVKYEYCRELGLLDSKAREYESTQYPVHVPVTYFQGVWDGSTEASLAIAHYKQVAQASKQLLLLPEGGHNPNLNILYGAATELGKGQGLLQYEILKLALRGQRVPEDLIRAFNLSGSERWAVAYQNWQSSEPPKPTPDLTISSEKSTLSH